MLTYFAFMRFCPFCAQENPDEGTHCAQCGKKLPPAPKRPGMRRADPTLAPAPSQARPPTTRFQTSAIPGVVPGATSAPVPSPMPGGTSAPQPIAPATSAPVGTSSSSGPVTTSTLGAVVVTRHGTDKPMTLSLPLSAATTGGPAAKTTTTPSAPPPAPPVGSVRGARAADGTPTQASGSGAVSMPISRAQEPGTGPISLPPPPSFPAEMHTPTAVRDATGNVPMLARPKTDAVAKQVKVEAAKTGTGSGTGTGTGLPVLETRHAKVMPMPRVPNAGNPIALGWYVIQVLRAISQRRRAIKWMQKDIVSQQESLDGVLGMLGRAAFEAKLDNAAFAEEMRAITAADTRRTNAEAALAELAKKRSAEDSRFAEQIGRLKDALGARAAAQASADKDLRSRQNERQKLRDEVGELEGRMKAYMRSSEEKENTAGRSEDATIRAAIRREAESLRNEARRLEGPRDAANRRLGEIAKPLAEAERIFDATQKDHDIAKKAVAEAQNAHDQVAGEITAGQNEHTTAKANAEREMARHFVTLGTMVNLHRVDRPELKPLYERVDTIRRSINGLEAEIEHLKAEKYARDRNTMQKGILVLAGAFVALVGLIVLLSIALS